MNIGRYLGIPYRKGGRGWDGADCYGFARIIIHEETGFEMPILSCRSSAAECDFRMYEKLDHPEDLSLAFLSGGPFGSAHVAVYADGLIIHMSESGPCCQNASRLRRFIRGYYRPRG